MAKIPDKFTSNQKALEYIGFLAATTRTNISTWNIPEMFAGENLQNLVLDAQEINKRFFEKLQVQKTTEKPKKKRIAKLKISPEQLAEAASKRAPGGAKFATQVKARLENVKQYERYIEDYQKSIRNYEISIEKARIEAQKLLEEWDKLRSQPAPDLKKQIKEVVKAGFFSDFKYHEGFLWCLTREVFMHSRRSPASLVSLGRYAIKFDLEKFSAQIYPHENNIFNGAQYYCHPFHDGMHFRFCGMTAEFEHAADNLDFVKYMELLAAMLEDAGNRGARHFEPDSSGGRNPALQGNFYPK